MFYLDALKKALVMVVVFGFSVSAFGRRDPLWLSRLLGSSGNSSISVYSNVNSEDESFYSSLRESRHQFLRKLDDELRDSRLELDAAIRQRNSLEAAEMMRAWPKCSAMDSEGRLCLKPCPSKSDLYCNAHRKYVPLFERYFDALSSMESDFAPSDVSWKISSFLPVSPSMDSIVFELDDGAIFKVVHVVRLGSSFAVSDENAKIVVIDDRRNYIDGDYVIGGKYIVNGVKQFGIAGLEHTVPSMRRITEREEERLRQKQEELNRRNAERAREILLDKYNAITKDLYKKTDEKFFDDPDSSARMVAVIRIKSAIDACHAALASFDPVESKKRAIELRRAWNEESATLRLRVEAKKQAEEDARIKWEKDHPEEMERKRREKLEQERREKEAKVAETQDKMRELERLVERYKKECTRNNYAPTTLGLMASRLRDRPSVPLHDAWGGLFVYEAEGEFYAILSAGPDHKCWTEDDIVVTNQKRDSKDANSLQTQIQPISEAKAASERAKAACERVRKLPRTGN